MRLQAYYSVLKPERTYANVMTTAAGFLFACQWHIDWLLLVSTLLGTTLIVMSACAANNATDRELDARMPRTNKRALVSGVISVRTVAWLSIILGVLGFAILIYDVNWLTVLLGAIGYIDYVVLYAWSKRRTPYSTLIGTVSGSVPIVAGYTAVTNRFDVTALLLGLILLCWQMSHFYAIGIYRVKDYAAGKLPIWPVVHGIASTHRWIVGYTALFVLVSLALAVHSSMGYSYSAVLTLIGGFWLFRGVRGFQTSEITQWAKQMFLTSLVVILVVSGMIALGPILI